MALSAEVIYFVRSDAINPVSQLCSIREVTIMKEQSRSTLMGVYIDMVDS
jgi:hypothetical protein